jgi:hypothetical protein
MATLKAQSSIGDFLTLVFTDFLALTANLTRHPIKIFGPKDSEACLHPPGVWWAPGDETWSSGQTRGQPGYPGALWVREIPLTVLVFGGENDPTGEATNPVSTCLRDADVTEWMVERLVNAFHRVGSQHSYQIVGMSWGEGARSGIGLACELDLTLRLPLVRIDNPTVTITGLTPTVEIDADGD